MANFTNKAPIEKALSVVNPLQLGDYTIGDVGCALVTDQGNLFQGVCIDVGSSMGFCAEHSAIAAMVTAGEFRIETIVAVWSDGTETYILSPCGRCREFIRQIHPDNIDTLVILDRHQAVPLRALLPKHDWFQQISTTSG